MNKNGIDICAETVCFSAYALSNWGRSSDGRALA